MTANDANYSDAPVASAGSQFSPSSLALKKIGLVALIVALAIYLLRLDQVVGLMIDDSWYVLLAQAMATGQGYTLINSPTPGILPLYPPGFPFVLSLAYRLYPKFPDNLWLLKSVSILAMFIGAIIVYRYLIRYRKLSPMVSMGVAFATLVCPPLVFLAASSVMSDCVFMLFSLLSIVTTEKAVESGRGKKMMLFTLLAAAFASSAYLTRSIAVALLAAGPLYFLKHRMFRAAILFTVLATLFCGPWMLHTRSHAPTPDQRMEQGGNMSLTYTYQFWQKLAGDPESPQISAGELPERVYLNILEVSGRDVMRILMAVVFEALRDPYKEAERMLTEGTLEGEIVPFSLFLSLFVIAGYLLAFRERLTFAEIALPLMLLVIVLWPFETIRYVLPLSPFVIFYFYRGVEGFQGLISRWNPNLMARWRLAPLLLLVVIALHLYGNVRSIINTYRNDSLATARWSDKFDEVQKAIRRLDQVAAKTDVVVSSNPALVTLYTGRKSVGWDNPGSRWETWKKLSVRYFAWLMVYPRPPYPEESKYRLVYRSNDGSNFRIVDFGPVEQRAPWGSASAAAVPSAK